MEPFEKIRNVDLNEGIKTIDLGIFVYEGDNNSLRVGSRIFKGNTPATVSGSVIGKVIRPDGGTVVYEGQLSDNIASILLTEAAFAYAGQLKITIRIISGEDKITVGSYTVDAKRTDTGTEIDPGDVVPDLEEIIALMDDMEDAEDAANAAAAAATEAAESIQVATVAETTSYMDMDGSSEPVDEVPVTGTTPTISAAKNTMYVCGTVSTLSFTPSATGLCAVQFTSGATPTVLTVPNTVVFPAWFDAATLEANTVYEISIRNGVYGMVATWQ